MSPKKRTTNGKLTHISLFSGIGGFDLAAEWAGFRTIAMCEIDPFCQEVLKARFGAVADTCGAGLQGGLPERKDSGRQTIAGHVGRGSELPVLIPDIRDFDGTRFRGATLLTGGFPCQPFSHAGKRRGKADDRYLWPEMLRVISEAKPTWIIGENVSGLASMVTYREELPVDPKRYSQDEMAAEREAVGEVREQVGRGVLDEIVESLEAVGYEVFPFIIPACAREACHQRDRIWVCARRIDKDPLDSRSRVGASQEPGHQRNERDALTGDGKRIHSESDRPAPQDPLLGGNGGRGDGDTPRLRRTLQTARPDSDAPDAEGDDKRAGLRESGPRGERRGRPADLWGTPWIEVATRLCRVDDGLPAWVHARRVARLKALGNAIVPQVAHQIIKAIAEIEGIAGTGQLPLEKP